MLTILAERSLQKAVWSKVNFENSFKKFTFKSLKKSNKLCFICELKKTINFALLQSNIGSGIQTPYDFVRFPLTSLFPAVIFAV